MSIRVLVADDDALVRAGLTMILGGAKEIEVVGEAENGREACAIVEAAKTTADPIDVVLMDIRMPVLDGIAATAEITARDCAPQVIVLTTFDADDYVVRALASGASGFLLKDTAPADIVAAICRVHEGEPTLSPTVTAQLISKVANGLPNGRENDARRLADDLSDREREVAVAIGAGMSNAEIAAALFMSVATVKAHISRIFTKLDASNRVQVAICMHDAGLL
ncbi:response regulator transcription factor [Tomitella biformata]|uniref:response regulator transcription factor n=1 Tax=Tomitella biformata TaxID=630403 RepID=UPI0004670F0D|nr:response regulator transcription factor [Tomitella biformata]